MTAFSFLCTCCGERHNGLPDLAYDAPLFYAELSDEEKETVARKSDDLCSIRDEHFFVRAVLFVPILGTDHNFGWGVWVSLSESNFRRYVEQFEAAEPEQDDGWFGWLSNRLPWYPDTLLLKTSVWLQPYPSRPLVELEPTDHLLSVHQREGVDLATLQRIVEAALHPKST